MAASVLELTKCPPSGFCKILLTVKKSTPNAMVYGELGRHPLSVTIKSRMLCFWFKLIQEDRKNK